MHTILHLIDNSRWGAPTFDLLNTLWNNPEALGPGRHNKEEHAKKTLQLKIDRLNMLDNDACIVPLEDIIGRI